MFRLAHLSDIHLGPLPDITYRELVSKRITGYINWRRNRRAQLHDEVLGTIVAEMLRQTPDHIAVTGDVMNLSLDREIQMSRLWLETLGEPDDVSVVPGNHDAYVPGALDRACRAWAPWMHDDGRAEPTRRGTFPYMRVRGPVALIGVSSARATAPFVANGFFGNRQARRLGELLDEAKRRKLFRLVMIHHPPVRGATSTHKRLFGIGRFQKVMDNHGADLVLHGHTHLATLHHLQGRDGDVPVVGVTPAGQAPGGHRPPAQFNMIEIDGKPGAWQVSLARHAITGVASGVELTSHEMLIGEEDQEMERARGAA